MLQHNEYHSSNQCRIYGSRIPRTPLSVRFYFIFMQFPAKIMPNNRLVPLELAPPVWQILDPPRQIGIGSQNVTEILFVRKTSLFVVHKLVIMVRSGTKHKAARTFYGSLYQNLKCCESHSTRLRRRNISPD